MDELDRRKARQIINTVGGNGIPPRYGFESFTAGLDPYLSVIKDDYLTSYVNEGGSAFKMVIGIYGGGKTHFLYCVRDIAWQNDIAVAYVSLSPGESPFHKLELVYRAIAKGIAPPLSPEEILSGYEDGISNFLRHWYGKKYQEFRESGLEKEELRDEMCREIESFEGLDSISFMKAIKAALNALLEKREEDFETVCQWLTGEMYDKKTFSKFGILQKIDKTTAFTMIRSLVQWVRQAGYNGLVVLFDEAERVSSLTTKQVELHLSNLRELIDECGQTKFQSVMIFYAVPDDNFLQNKGMVYEALKQRVATVFEEINPTGVRIELEKLTADDEEKAKSILREVGEKLSNIYMVAYDCEFSIEDCKQMITEVAEEAYGRHYADIGYKRLFVQSMVKALNSFRKNGFTPSREDMKEWKF